MKKMMTALCMAALASWVVTTAAQTQGYSTKSAKSPKTMTYTGCVQEGTTPGSYTLTGVSTSGTGTSGTGGNWGGTGTSGTSGTGTSASSGSGESGASGEAIKDMTYQLVPARGVDLKSHVGHKVEVTGTMETSSDKGASGTSGSGAGAAGTGTSGAGSMSSSESGSSGSAGMEHMLHVQKVKMISTTCSGQ